MREPVRAPLPVPWSSVAERAAQSLAYGGLVVFVLAVAAFVLLMVSLSCGGRNAAVVRNRSGAEMRDVHLVVTWFDDPKEVLLDERADVLGDGGELRFDHRGGDAASVLTFTIDGTPHRHEQAYIDLWSGETWVLSVGKGGEIDRTSEFR